MLRVKGRYHQVSNKFMASLSSYKSCISWKRRKMENWGKRRIIRQKLSKMRKTRIFSDYKFYKFRTIKFVRSKMTTKKTFI